MGDVAALEAGRAVVYAGGGALALKAAEFLLKTFGATHAIHTSEMQATLEASAAIREAYRKDNEELRERERWYAQREQELETRIETLEQEYHAVRELNDKLRTENDDLKASVRVHEARERGRAS